PRAAARGLPRPPAVVRAGGAALPGAPGGRRPRHRLVGPPVALGPEAGGAALPGAPGGRRRRPRLVGPPVALGREAGVFDINVTRHDVFSSFRAPISFAAA